VTHNPAARTVVTVEDLKPIHVRGTQIRIPDLHMPGLDFDAPHVTVTGRLYSMRRTLGGWLLDVRRTHAGPSLLDTPIPGTHPCYLVREDPPPAPEPEAIPFDWEEIVTRPNPAARVRAAKQAREVRQWQEVSARVSTSIHCDNHPDRTAVRYHPATGERFCAECEASREEQP
jgi:hypothetical protein